MGSQNVIFAVHPLFSCYVSMYWVFIISVFSVTLCLYVVCCVLYNDVHILVQVNTVSVLF